MGSEVDRIQTDLRVLAGTGRNQSLREERQKVRAENRRWLRSGIGPALAILATPVIGAAVGNYYEDEEQRQSTVCFEEHRKAADLAELDAEDAAKRLEGDPEGQSFVSIEVYQWCGSPVDVIEERLENSSTPQN